MDELIKLVTQKVGLSADQAKQAIDTVMGFLMEKLPAPIAGQIKSALEGSGAAGVADKAKDLGQGIGNLFGKK